MNFTLRPWTLNDLTSVTHHGCNPNISKFMSDAFPDTEAKWKNFLDFATTDESILYLAIDIDGEAVGGIGVTPQKDFLRKNAELGYWLSEQYWGRGIMTRATKEIVKRAFERFDIEWIFATPYDINKASHRVLEKAGFKLEAKLEKIEVKNGVELDELIYGIRKNSKKLYHQPNRLAL